MHGKPRSGKPCSVVAVDRAAPGTCPTGKHYIGTHLVGLVHVLMARVEAPLTAEARRLDSLPYEVGIISRCSCYSHLSPQTEIKQWFRSMSKRLVGFCGSSGAKHGQLSAEPSSFLPTCRWGTFS